MGLLPQLRLRNVHTPLSYSLRRAPGPANHGGPGVRLSAPFTNENRPSVRKPGPKDGRRSAKSSVGQERASGNTRPVVRKKDGLPIGFLTERQKGEYGDGSKMEPRNQNFIASQHPMQLVGPRLSPYQWGFPRPTEHVSSGDRTWPRPTFHLGWLYYSTQPPTCEDRLCDWHYKRI